MSRLRRARRFRSTIWMLRWPPPSSFLQVSPTGNYWITFDGNDLVRPPFIDNSGRAFIDMDRRTLQLLHRRIGQVLRDTE